MFPEFGITAPSSCFPLVLSNTQPEKLLTICIQENYLALPCQAIADLRQRLSIKVRQLQGQSQIVGATKRCSKELPGALLSSLLGHLGFSRPCCPGTKWDNSRKTKFLGFSHIWSLRNPRPWHSSQIPVESSSSFFGWHILALTLLPLWSSILEHNHEDFCHHQWHGSSCGDGFRQLYPPCFCQCCQLFGGWLPSWCSVLAHRRSFSCCQRRNWF